MNRISVVYDCHTFTVQKFGGISRYFSQLATKISSFGNNVKIVSPLFQNRYLREIPKEITCGKYLDSFPPKTTRAFLKINQMLSKPYVNYLKPDIIHETYYSKFSYKNVGQPIVITVYDMIHELFPHFFSSFDNTVRNKRISVGRADHVICISENTKKDLINIYNVDPSKITVTHLGYDFSKITYASKQINSYSVKPFLLYVGARSGYKNFNKLLAAFASSQLLRSEFDIVAFGGGVFTKSEMSYISELGIPLNSVKQVDGSDELLSTYYSNARAFVYPSLYEGFGIPPLEAMAHRCPVICSNTSSLPEVVGNAGVYFDPVDFDSIRATIEETVLDDSMLMNLVDSGIKQINNFSWDKCARETLGVYNKILGNS